MIKLDKNIKIVKNFQMEYPTAQAMPSNIDDKDINAMFCGVLRLMKIQAKQQINTEIINSKNSYNYLLKMYLLAVKNMNKYKKMYFKLKESLQINN